MVPATPWRAGEAPLGVAPVIWGLFITRSPDLNRQCWIRTEFHETLSLAKRRKEVSWPLLMKPLLQPCWTGMVVMPPCALASGELWPELAFALQDSLVTAPDITPSLRVPLSSCCYGRMSGFQVCSRGSASSGTGFLFRKDCGLKVF